MVIPAEKLKGKVEGYVAFAEKTAIDSKVPVAHRDEFVVHLLALEVLKLSRDAPDLADAILVEVGKIVDRIRGRKVL